MIRGLLSKVVAAGVTAALILTTPGLGCYEALAQVRGPIGAPVEVAPVAPAPGGMPVSPVTPASFTQPALTLPVGINAAPVPVAAPIVQPGVSASAAAPARAAAAPAPVATARTAAPAPVAAARMPVAAPLAAARTAAPARGAAEPARAAPKPAGAIGQAAWAGRELESGKAEPSETISTLYEAGRVRRTADDGLVAGAFGASAPSGLKAGFYGSIGRAAEVPAPADADGGGSPAPKKSRRAVAVILALAALGGAGAFFAAPAVLAFAAAQLPAWAAAYLTASPILATSALTLAGALSGVAASQVETWRGFPRALWETTLSAGSTTFRAFAVAGLRFDSALRGKTYEDDGAAVPKAFWKYPLLAWGFVGLGYAVTPVAAGIGFLYKAAGTPVVAAWRGLKQLAVEFFPWLVEFVDLVVKALRKTIPFMGGFLWGAVQAGGIAVAFGAVTLARPIFENVIGADYAPKTVPGWVGARLAQLLGLAGVVATGLVGGVLGLLLSPAYVLTHALLKGLEYAGSTGKLRSRLDLWKRALEREEGFPLIGSASFERDGASSKVPVGAALARLLNATSAAPHGMLALGALSVVAYFRSWKAALQFERDGYFPPEQTRAVTLEKAKTEAEPPAGPKAEPRFFGPFLWMTLGSFLGMQLYSMFLAVPIGLIGWPGVAAYAVTGLLGAGAGLAWTRRKMLAGLPGRVLAYARNVAGESFRFWARTGLYARAAVRNAGPDEALYREAPLELSRYPLGAWPAVLGGYVAGAAGFLFGAAWQAAAIPAGAAWEAFVGMIESVWPFIRKLARFVRRVLRRIVPFAFGLVAGAAAGLWVSGFTGAKVFTQPFLTLAESFRDGELGRVEKVATYVAAAGALVAFLAAGLLGFAAGLVYGIPAALVSAFALASQWGDVGGRARRFAGLWLRTARSETETLERMTAGAFGKSKPRFWTAAVQAANAAAGAVLLAFTASVPWLMATGRAAKQAWTLAGRAPRADDDARSRPPFGDEARGTGRAENGRGRDGDSAGETAAAGAERAETPAPETPPIEAPAEASGPVWVTATLGLGGMLAAMAGAAYFILPMAGLWWLAGSLAAAGLAGGFAGLALSQPKSWRGAFARATVWTKASAAAAFDHWERLGAAYDRTLKDTDADVPRRAGWLHAAFGAAAALFSGATGLAYGLALTPLRAAARGLRQVYEELWPWLKRALDFAWRLIRRAGPFLFGWIAGAVTGFVGAALFGALVGARPYFKYIVGVEFEKGGVLNWLGRAALKALAFVAALFLGAAGLVVGLVIAAPYAITLMPAMAFQLADVDSKVTRFFDLWTKVRMKEEMKLVNDFTSRLSFPSAPGKPVALGDGWVRLLTLGIFSLTFPFATLILGVVGYFRSIYRAFKDAREGREVPPAGSYDDPGVVGETAWKGAKGTARWLSRLLPWVGLFGGYWLAKDAGFFAAVLKGMGWSLAGLVGGWLGGLILGGLIGMAVGTILYLHHTLENAPAPKSEDR